MYTNAKIECGRITDVSARLSVLMLTQRHREHGGNVLLSLDCRFIFCTETGADEAKDLGVKGIVGICLERTGDL